MYLIFVLSAILSVSLADPLACCFPSRFSGWVLENEGILKPNQTQAEAVDDMIELHYDYNKRMQAVVSHRLDTDKGVRNNVTIIYDYKNSKMYILPQDGSCHVEQLDPASMIPNCALQNFTYTDSYTVGSGVKNFQVNVFEGNFGSLSRAILVTSDCIPFAERMYGIASGGVQTVGGMLFMDIDPNGVDDSVFSVPAKCQAGPASTGVGKRDLELLRLSMRPLTNPGV